MRLALLLVSSFLVSTACSCIPTVDARGGRATPTAALGAGLYGKTWKHGAEDCASNEDPAIEAFRFSDSSYVLRQNKCLSYEAPFIYMLLGEDKVLVVDTGATESASEFPLYETVGRLLEDRGASDKPLLVVHSHGHGDHRAGDAQFRGKPGVTVVKPKSETMRAFFDFGEWPKGEAHIELGTRRLTVIPTPGHHEDAISIYDPQTKWLLTGDTFYPGYIYVRDWDAYKQSIARLIAFAHANEIRAVLGAHIEMKKEPGEYYRIGTTYQPDEAGLALPADALVALGAKLETLDEPTMLIFDDFIVAPMSGFQKAISSAAKWFFD